MKIENNQKIKKIQRNILTKDLKKRENILKLKAYALKQNKKLKKKDLN